MSKVDFEALKQISAEMNAIVNKSEQDGRQINREEQAMLDQLAARKEDLLNDTLFHGYGS